MKQTNFLFGFFVLLFVGFTSANAQVADIPYFHDFEDAEENARWVIPTSPTINKWFIGTGTPASSPTTSAYITNDNGTSAAYSNNVSNTLPFYREFNTVADKCYRLTFDFKVYGQGSSDNLHDYLNIYWVDDPSVNVSEWATTNSYEPANATPYYKESKNYLLAWTKYKGYVIGNGSTAKLVFLWVNDNTLGSNPGGCIDNVKLEPVEIDPIWVNREIPQKNYTPEELVKKIFIKDGGCSVSNVTFTGEGWSKATQTWTSTDRSLGYFSHGTDNGLGVQSGLILATGYAKDVEGPNISEHAMTFQGLIGTDTDLNGLLTGQYNTHTISILEFDFVPSINTVSFDYIFASEEYPEFSCDIFNDVFGFFISGPGIPGNKRNIAIIPGTTNTPVSIDNLHPKYKDYCYAANSEYYVDGTDNTYTEFDGHTKLFTTAVQAVIPGQSYHLKLAIGNVFDNKLGSGVFLRAGSLDLGMGITNHGNMLEAMDNVFEGCGENQFVIKLDNQSPNSVYITLNYSGAAVNDIVSPDGTPLPTTVEIPAGASEVVIPYVVSSPVTINGGDFNINVVFDYCQNEGGLNHTIYVYKKIQPQISINTPCGATNGTVSVAVTEGTPNAKLSIDNENIWHSVYGFSTELSIGQHKILFKDSIGCNVDTVYIIVPPSNVKDTAIIESICQGQTYIFDGTPISVSGTYYKTLQTSDGCDSIVTLYLTVTDVFYETIYDTICDGEVYEFNGQIISETGTYNAELQTVNGCDSIVTLILEAFDNRVNIQISNPICANDEEFTFTLSQNSNPSAVMPTDYKINFEEKTVPEGFVNFTAQQGTINANEITVQIPEKIYPDTYSCTVTLSNSNNSCAANSYTVNYAVLYPSSIMEQKWDDVIALLNEAYNGGFKFAGYQWYFNGQQLLDETKSYIYIKNGSLVVGGFYSVLITREDGSKIFSCPYEAQPPKQSCCDYPTVVNGGEVIKISLQNKTAIFRFITVTGIVLSSKTVNSDDEIFAPTQQGVYLLEILSENNTKEVVKIIVK